MVETGRVVLHMQNSSDRQSSVDLIGDAFALPCLCYAEDGWQRRARLSGPPCWAVCHVTAREPPMFLGHLHSDDVRLPSKFAVRVARIEIKESGPKVSSRTSSLSERDSNLPTIRPLLLREQFRGFKDSGNIRFSPLHPGSCW